MTSSSSTKMVLKEILDILRCGLSALVPIIERAGIPWREGDAYDDWESIASTLYEQIVVNTVRAATEVNVDLSFPKYDLVYPSYERMAYFEVYSLKSRGTHGPFVGFEASESSFQNVKYVPIEDRAESTTTTVTAHFADCGIRLRTPNGIASGLEAVTLCD